MAATVRENVLFGAPYEESWYQQVLEASALNQDLELLADGDATEIGERGVNLSGGQKARIGLARAIYAKAEVVLLDDPLAAVDPSVGEHLFYKAVQGLLKESLVVLATHQAWSHRATTPTLTSISLKPVSDLGSMGV